MTTTPDRSHPRRVPDAGRRPGGGRRWTRVAAALAAGVLLVGCATEPPGPDEPSDDGAGDAPAASPLLDGLPPGPAGEHLTWILAIGDQGRVPDADEIEPRLSRGMVERFPETLPQVTAALASIAADGPYELVDVRGGEDQLVAEITLGEDQRGTVMLRTDADGRIDLFAPLPLTVPEVEVGDVEDAVAGFAEIGELRSALVARVDDDGCTPLAELDPDTTTGVQSTAKLYVLDAVAQAVADGEVAWDDEITLTDEDRSLPSGWMQFTDAGSTYTVAETAQAMMRHSDNTATDHLVTLVGRDAVEAAVTASGHADPDQLTPFPRTREFFQLGWGDEDVRRAWAEAQETGDIEARRQLLEQLDDGVGEVDPMDVVTSTAWQDGVDWYASATDLCGVWARLADRDDAVLRDEVLALTPQDVVGTNATVDHDAWEYVAAKDGGAAGAHTQSWYLERDGERYVATVSVAGEPDLDVLSATGRFTALLEELAAS